MNMTRLARTASECVVAFSLLTLAATAYAECAWVLWSESKMVTPAGLATQMVMPEGAFDSKNACQMELAAVVSRSDLPFPGWKSTKSEDVTIFTNPQGGGLMTKYKCLPDTVDPRGPKGK